MEEKKLIIKRMNKGKSIMKKMKSMMIKMNN